MDLVRVARVLSAVSIAGGLLAIIVPAMVADVFGFDIQRASGLGFGEVGALYGGNFVGLGLGGLYATRENFDEGALLLASIGVIWFSIAGGRAIVMLTRAADASSGFGWLSFGLEAMVGIAYMLASRTTSRPL